MSNSRQDMREAMEARRRGAGLPTPADVYGADPSMAQIRRRLDPNTVLQPEESGEVLRGFGVRLDALGLHVEREISNEELDTVITILLRLNDRVQLWLGDSIIELMRRNPGLDLETIAAQYDYKLSTLATIVNVCNACPKPLRGAKLDYSHYKVVYAVEDRKLRADLLKKANANGWSVRRLRQELEKHLPPTLPSEESINAALDEVKRAVLRVTSSGAGEDQRRIFAEYLVQQAKEIYPKVRLG